MSSLSQFDRPMPKPDGGGGQVRRSAFRLLGAACLLTALVLVATAMSGFVADVGTDPFGAVSDPGRFLLFSLVLPFFAAGAILLTLATGGASPSYGADGRPPARGGAARRFSLGDIAPRQAGVGPDCRSCGGSLDLDAAVCATCGSLVGG